MHLNAVSNRLSNTFVVYLPVALKDGSLKFQRLRLKTGQRMKI